MKLHNPVDAMRITSEFGWREIFGKMDWHSGIDIGDDKINDNIYSIADGKVVYRNNDEDGYGLYIVVEHDGFCSLYAHLREFKAEVNDVVGEGTIIGLMGSTGRSTGKHLHFEIRDVSYGRFWERYPNREFIHCVDPIKHMMILENRDRRELTDLQMFMVSDYAKKSWGKAYLKHINDGINPKGIVTEEQLMVFFDKLGLLD